MARITLTQYALKGEFFEAPILFAINHMPEIGAYAVHASRASWAYDASSRLLKRYHRSPIKVIEVTKKPNTEHVFTSIERK